MAANNEIRKDKLPYRMAGGIMALCYWLMAFPSIIEPPYEQSLWYRIFQIAFHLVWALAAISFMLTGIMRKALK